MTKWFKLFFIGMIILMIVSIAAMLNHVFYCIREELWLFLIAGAVAPPVGVVHGIGLWLGYFP